MVGTRKVKWRTISPPPAKKTIIRKIYFFVVLVGFSGKIMVFGCPSFYFLIKG